MVVGGGLLKILIQNTKFYGMKQGAMEYSTYSWKKLETLKTRIC